MSGRHDHSYALDEFAHLDTPIHRWDTRYKMIALVALIFAFAAVQDLWLLIPMVIVTDVLYAVSALPRTFRRARLEVPGYFVAALVILLPFIAGETVLATFGRVELRLEGIESAILITVRFLSIMTVALVLFGTDSFINSIKALRALRMPVILADMVLLTYRYIFEIGAFFGTMRTAARMRGFNDRVLSVSGVATMSSLLGHMLVRSYEQSERVYKAMILRGYGAGPLSRDEFQATGADTARLAIVLLIAVAFVAAQLYLNTQPQLSPLARLFT